MTQIVPSSIPSPSPVEIAIVCFINDPFDKPGGRRIGGGHLVLRELAEELICQGFDVSLITRLNSPLKPSFQSFGPRYRIYRLQVGRQDEMSPAEVGELLNPLEEATSELFLRECKNIKAIHSQYWIAGEVCRRVNKKLNLRHVHHMLSFGRQKRNNGEQIFQSDDIRDKCEVLVMNSVDIIVAQCPSEAKDLISYYPELNHRRIAIIPHGVDINVFNNQ